MMNKPTPPEPKPAERKKNDGYQTDPALCRKLVELLDKQQADLLPSRIGYVLEPSAGEGNFVRALADWVPNDSRLEAVDLTAEKESLHECGAGNVYRCDFLEFVPGRKYSLICGNPPYREALRHVVRALDLLEEGGTLAFLLRLGFLESQGRIEFWKRHRCQLVTVLSERPSFTGGKTDNSAYGFFVWRKPVIIQKNPEINDEEQVPPAWQGQPTRLDVWSWRS